MWYAVALGAGPLARVWVGLPCILYKRTPPSYDAKCVMPSKHNSSNDVHHVSSALQHGHVSKPSSKPQG
eukprot:5888605-Amphidinium_carterae.1